jgi:hypothetical protein
MEKDIGTGKGKEAEPIRISALPGWGCRAGFI